ncbi:MAG TPA: hypothetical protein VF865_21310, partial [Acidobacteriaceae bacterium]
MPRRWRQEEASQRATVGVEDPPRGSATATRQGRIQRPFAAILAADVAPYLLVATRRVLSVALGQHRTAFEPSAATD